MIIIMSLITKFNDYNRDYIDKRLQIEIEVQTNPKSNLFSLPKLITLFNNYNFQMTISKYYNSQSFFFIESYWKSTTNVEFNHHHNKHDNKHYHSASKFDLSMQENCT